MSTFRINHFWLACCALAAHRCILHVAGHLYLLLGARLIDACCLPVTARHLLSLVFVADGCLDRFVVAGPLLTAS